MLNTKKKNKNTKALQIDYQVRFVYTNFLKYTLKWPIIYYLLYLRHFISVISFKSYLYENIIETRKRVVALKSLLIFDSL